MSEIILLHKRHGFRTLCADLEGLDLTGDGRTEEGETNPIGRGASPCYGYIVNGRAESHPQFKAAATNVGTSNKNSATGIQRLHKAHPEDTLSQPERMSQFGEGEL